MNIDKELWLTLKHGAGSGGILNDTEFVDDGWELTIHEDWVKK